MYALQRTAPGISPPTPTTSTGATPGRRLDGVRPIRPFACPGATASFQPRDTEGPERSEDAECARVCGNSIRMGLPARSSAARPTSTDISGRECSSTRTRSRPGAHLAGLVVPPTCGPARRPALQFQRRCPRGRQVGADPEKGVNKGGPPKPLTPLKPQCHAVDVLTLLRLSRLRPVQRQFLGKGPGDRPPTKTKRPLPKQRPFAFRDALPGYPAAADTMLSPRLQGRNGSRRAEILASCCTTKA
jgi:hypothetical protein